MSVLGIYIKQPVEVEIYGIQFAKDMAPTDQIETAWQMIARDKTDPWDQIYFGMPYTALLTDDDRRIVTDSTVTLPANAPEGYRLNVANYHQTNNVLVDTFLVPAKGSTIVVKTGGVWKEEAKTTAVLVDAVNDQRVRTTVSGGTPFESYKVDVTVTTSEGRTMQNEFIVEIEED